MNIRFLRQFRPKGPCRTNSKALRVILRGIVEVCGFTSCPPRPDTPGTQRQQNSSSGIRPPITSSSDTRWRSLTKSWENIGRALEFPLTQSVDEGRADEEESRAIVTTCTQMTCARMMDLQIARADETAAPTANPSVWRFLRDHL